MPESTWSLERPQKISSTGICSMVVTGSTETVAGAVRVVVSRFWHACHVAVQSSSHFLHKILPLVSHGRCASRNSRTSTANDEEIEAKLLFEASQGTLPVTEDTIYRVGDLSVIEC